MALGRRKMPPSGPMMAISNYKMTPKTPQDSLMWPWGGPKVPQGASRMAQDGPRRPQEGPKRPQDGSKRAQKRAQEASKRDPQ
jgi:hypothetical protein